MTALDQILRTDSLNQDFISLVKDLDIELWKRYGDEQQFFSQFNKTDTLKHTVVAYRNGKPAGCGALRKYSDESVEIKRMFVKPDFRGDGIASKILKELENWAGELGFDDCILETGTLQPEAVRLYTKNGFQRIPNFGQYAMVARSICMQKRIRK